ncbi:MAG: dimethylargininase [Sciscionella sp.]
MTTVEFVGPTGADDSADPLPVGSVSLALAAERVATRRQYLMCPPTYFTVEYAINPWMHPEQPVDTALAVRQWAHLAQTYRELGHCVHTIDAQPGLPDMVFAANSGTVVDGRVLGARFRAPQRSAEAEHYRRWFGEHGYRDVVMPTSINEAEGDFAWTGSLLLAGTGFRTDPGAHDEAQEILGVPVVSLRLVDPRFYHLDVALFVLSEGALGRAQIAYFPEAFSAGSQRVLRRLFPDAILATAADAECLGLNAVSDGRNVVLPLEAHGLAQQVAARGYHPVFVDISELRRSGGGPKCCTMELRD